MNDDTELLRRYCEAGEDDAFGELVQRHVNLVYSAALRQLNGDAHLAADATQLVFTDLARKARSVAGHRVLAGWLFTSTRFATAKLVRGERRRHAREVQAHLMQTLTNDEPADRLDWQRVRSVLDDVMSELAENDREAILLRYFEGRDYASIGAKLNLAANSARMRVDRALEKLRGLLEQRGVTSTTAALATALANQAVIAAPAGLAATVAGTALAAGAAIAGSVGGGTAVAASFMSMTKLQLGLSGALAVAASTGFVVQAGANARLHADMAQLRQENAAIAPLRAENQKLSRIAAEVAELGGDDAEFARLQEQATTLKKRLQDIARVEQSRAALARNNTEVYDIARLDRQPTPRSQARPVYPAEMRSAGAAGEVVVDFVVDVNGDVQNAFALRSSQREFETAAVEAVSKWKFQPGQKGGRTVATHLQVPIVFNAIRQDATPGGMTVK
jgi:RNA polymerase sigma factor (sigma-70 family)